MTDSPPPASDIAANGSRPERFVRAIVSGCVQGVGYRAWTQAEAEALGLSGWVRNRMNGDVEALFAGPAAAIEELCEKLWRGPPAARVARVELSQGDESDLAANGRAPGFCQIATI
ncbi:Acylphosphatase [Methylocella tundrae]|uniref:acylphosphatase n=1 Tax=Methylocella tundrae TaxID=227605 RepID=A0A8B6M504_METTU|nr:acylphosphatase [Methylocella tundrae]VTZ50091.1 Acylphosphatase [Methylocella tundrae]